jgi:hypothetical protein
MLRTYFMQLWFKQGRTARSLRIIFQAIAKEQGQQHYQLDIDGAPTEAESFKVRIPNAKTFTAMKAGKPTHARLMRRQMGLRFLSTHKLDGDTLPISHISYVRSEDGAVR